MTFYLGISIYIIIYVDLKTFHCYLVPMTLFGYVLSNDVDFLYLSDDIDLLLYDLKCITIIIRKTILIRQLT